MSETRPISERMVEWVQGQRYAIHKTVNSFADEVAKLEQTLKWIACASRQEIEEMLAQTAYDDAEDASMSNEQRYHAEWCDRMNGGPECNCDAGDTVPAGQGMSDREKRIRIHCSSERFNSVNTNS